MSRTVNVVVHDINGENSLGNYCIKVQLQSRYKLSLNYITYVLRKCKPLASKLGLSKK
jgi:hypothetical protein